MKLAIFTLFLSLFLHSCSVQQPTVPMISHADVMALDYPTKKTVFIKFGTPTSKETFANIENWHFKLSEVTYSTSFGFATGSGRIMQNPMNLYLNAIDRSLITNQQQASTIRTNSTTRETYVKFWFVNDTVIKWESFGVDYSRPIPETTNALTPSPLIPEYAKEFLYSEANDKVFIYSHNSIERQINGGINGPLRYLEVLDLVQNHLDFKSALLPSIDELKKVYDSNSKLRYVLLKNSLVVWSSNISPNGNVQCLNFRSGEIVEKNPESLNYFVPLVKLKL
jgi:hypothetical protein